MKINNLIWVGTIVNTHSLKGELKILSNSDDIKSRFKVGNTLYLEDESELLIKSFRKHKNFILLSFEGKNRIEDVEFLKGKKIFCNREILKEGDFYFKDLIGFDVFTLKNELVGKIKSFFDQGPYYSFDIKDSNNKNINIPILDEFIKEIDFKNKKIIIFDEKIL